MGLPKFYLSYLNQWASLLKAKEKVHNYDEILHQSIIGNDLILINKEPLFLNHRTRGGLIKKKDIHVHVCNND